LNLALREFPLDRAVGGFSFLIPTTGKRSPDALRFLVVGRTAGVLGFEGSIARRLPRFVAGAAGGVLCDGTW